MTIIPLTLLAAAGSLVWLEGRFVLAWLVAVGGFIGLHQATGRWLEKTKDPRIAHEWLLAFVTLLYSGIYGLLPFALLVDGNRTAVLAGAAILGAIALSSTAEFAISRKIGAASLVSLGVIATASVLWPHVAESRTEAFVATVAGLAFLTYVLITALHRATAQSRLFDALKMARDKEAEAASANAAKTVFLATMSHEIRTPLNGLLGMVQVMQGDTLAPAQRDRLDIVRKSGESLTAILNDVLDLSKIEAGRMEIESAPFDLGDVLESCHHVFSALATEKGLVLTLEIDPAAAGVYESDAPRLRQVVGNLLSNAVKFTAAGEIRLAARRQPDGVEISISDTGQGIALEHLDKLFSKFNQLDASTTRRHGGTGLGLAICHELCSLMGGAISVESAPGKGSTFTIALPLQRLAMAHSTPLPTKPVLTDQGRTSPLRVLAAEDNPVNQMVLEAILSQAGVPVHMTPDGEQAVQAWAREPWDVILMDVHMPVMDGVKATQEIRRRETAEGRARTPIIALTANAMTHQVEAFLAEGFDGHVGKPIDVTTLFTAMDRAIRN